MMPYILKDMLAYISKNTWRLEKTSLKCLVHSVDI